MLAGLKELGCTNIIKPKGAMYVWFPIPRLHSYDWMVYPQKKRA